MEREAKIIRENLEGKEYAKLDVVDEIMDITKELENVYYEMTMESDEITEAGVNGDEVNYEIYDRLQEESKKLYEKRKELLSAVRNWKKSASVMEKMTVIAVTLDSAQNYYDGPVGACYQDVINDAEVQSNDELMKKMGIFKEKCSVVTDGTVITLGGAYKGADFICTSIKGEQEIINSNARYAEVNFETGEVRNYHDSIRPDWVIDEEYTDPSIILSEKEAKLAALEQEEATISAAEELINKKENEGPSIEG